MVYFLAFLLANFLLYFGLVHVSAHSKLRHVCFLLIVPLALMAARSSLIMWFPGGVGCEYAIGFILHASNFLLRAKLSPPKDADAGAASRWGVNMLLSARWATKVAPGPRYTRWRLFWRRLLDAAVLYGIVWMMQRYALETEAWEYLNVPNGVLRRLGDLSRREWTVRIFVASNGYAMQYLGLRMCHALASCVAMMCGQDPEDWPPLFGDVREAYTVRRYFGCVQQIDGGRGSTDKHRKFWHTCMRKAFTSHAVALCRAIGLPLQHPITRGIVLVLCFALSAAMHTLSAPGIERCGLYPQIRYYTLVVLVILLEDMAIGAFRSMRQLFRPSAHKVKKPRTAEAYPQQQKPALVWRLLGYVWVYAFHMWTGSMLIFGLWTRCAV